MNQIEKLRAEVCAPKYLQKGESFKEGMSRIADTLKDNQEHYEQTREILLEQRFLPGGRVQSSIGSARSTTAFNCYVSPIIYDNSESIFDVLGKGFQTLRLGGGDGFDFSNLRPLNSRIKTLDSNASGPVSFMKVYDAMCETVKSAGHRRGAMMATLRIDHPDIEEFITCKQQPGVLTNFNISVLVTDEFMKALESDGEFDLVFEGRVYSTVSAKYLWNKIMRNTWDHAEPGVLFVDRINQKNNLNYCETITCTNPCGEQPLPPNGACLLGSFNLTKYVYLDIEEGEGMFPAFDWKQFQKDIPPIVRMMDNVIDNTIYPLPEQETEAKDKRRMGLGLTGVANAAEFLGLSYGSKDMLDWLEMVMMCLRDMVYQASIDLAIEKGPFPAFDPQFYSNVEGTFANSLPEHIKERIMTYGIRNSHLLSIAPTGTISLWAGNISGGIEPVFSHVQDRNAYVPETGEVRSYHILDYAYDQWGLKGATSEEISADAHIDVLCLASRYVDSACSKTCNVGDDVTFDEFKELYLKAYHGGASGCTTFRPAGFRKGIITKGVSEMETKEQEVTEGAACFIDPLTGLRSCAD